MRRLAILLAFVVVAQGVSLPQVASATIPDDVKADAREVARTVPRGAWMIASAPFRRANLRRTATAIGILGASTLLDRPIRRGARLHLSDAERNHAHDLSTAMDPRHEMGAAVATYVVGLLVRLPGVRRAGLRATEALAVNQVFTIGIKDLVGRERPFADGDPYRFRPFSGAASFPSGHTTAAFTTATVLSRSATTPAVSIPAYGLAGSVAAARISVDAHWASDVLAAGYLGYHIGAVFTP